MYTYLCSSSVYRIYFVLSRYHRRSNSATLFGWRQSRRRNAPSPPAATFRGSDRRSVATGRPFPREASLEPARTSCAWTESNSTLSRRNRRSSATDFFDRKNSNCQAWLNSMNSLVWVSFRLLSRFSAPKVGFGETESS